MALIKNVLNRFGYEKAEKKMAGFMAAEIEGQHTDKPEAEKVSEYKDFIDAFRQLPWLYAAAISIAVASTKPKLKVMKDVGGKLEEVTGEELNHLIMRPNPFLSNRELKQITIVNLVITGNAYWNLVGTQENEVISEANPPVEIWWMKPEQVNIKPHPKKFIESYEFQTSTMNKPKPLDPSEVIHFKLANPDSYFLGLGMLQPAKNTAIMEFNAVAYNKNFIKNDATPRSYFFSEGNMTKEQRKQHRSEWNKVHKGPKKAGIMGYCSGGLEIKELGKSPREAQYIEMRKMNRQEILACLGVPPSVVGLLEYANYSNMEVQQKKFWQDTVIPILDLIADKLTLDLGPNFSKDYYFEYDYSNIKVLQDDEKEKSDIAKILINSGIMTPNQVRADLYNKESYEGGDTYYMPMSMVPVGQESAKKTKSLPEKEKKVKTSYWQEPTKKKVLWENFVKRVNIKEKPFTLKVDEYFKDQVKRLREKLKKLKKEDIPNLRIAELFDQDKEEKIYFDKLKQRYFNAFVEAGEAGMSISKGMLYDPEMKSVYKQEGFNFDEALKQQLEKIVMESGGIINKKTVKELLKQINLAQSEGWTVEELAQNLLGTAEEPGAWFSHNRSRRISRTEMCNVENFGQVEGYKQSPYVELKGWLSAFSPETRESHMDADHRYSDEPISLNEPFIVGGELLQYPGDPSRSTPGNVINCLCSTYPEVRQI